MPQEVSSLINVSAPFYGLAWAVRLFQKRTQESTKICKHIINVTIFS